MNEPEYQVIEIDPNGKYIIQVPRYLNNETIREIRDKLNDWWSDTDAPFAFLSADLKLVRVDNAQETTNER